MDTGRAYIIILIPRGRAALQNIGVPLPEDPMMQTRGTVRHNNKGEVRAAAAAVCLGSVSERGRGDALTVLLLHCFMYRVA